MRVSLTARAKILFPAILLLTAVRPAFADRYSSLQGRIEALNGSRFARVAEIGRSVQDRPIYAVAMVKSLSPDETRILILCGQHGGERSATYGMLGLAEELANTDNPRLRALLDRLVVVLVPVVNPDGFMSSHRLNSAGADLNRDWISASQPETQAVLALVKQIRPQVVLDLHQWTDSHPRHGDGVEVAGYGVDSGHKLARLLSQETFMPTVYYRAQTDPRLAHRYFTERGMCAMLVETSSRWSPEARQLAYRKLVLEMMTAIAAPEPLVADQLAALQGKGVPQFAAFTRPEPKPSTDPRQTACWIVLLASVGFLIVRSARKRPEPVNERSHRLPITELVRWNVPIRARVALLQQYRLRPTDRSKARA